MFVKYRDNQNVPIKMWIEPEDVEDGAMEQAIHMAKLPFIHKHVALLPDTHRGHGVPIGGVLPTKGVVIPHATGVDLGCGMKYVQFDIDASLLREVETGMGKLGKMIASQINREIPTGFDSYDEPQFDDFFRQSFGGFDWMKAELGMIDKLKEQGEIEKTKHQVGTLGGGNHFIELQEDTQSGKLGLMIHSGSRHYGYAIAKYFNKVAKEMNNKWYSSVPEDWELAFLSTDCHKGKSYMNWMKSAMAFAKDNRDKMAAKAIDTIMDSFQRHTDKQVQVEDSVHCHHNYASKENHFGENVIVHRKGAIRAREGDMGIVPGAMGSYSYIVEGKGNDQSFHSSAHGAGRRMSRTQAKDQFTTQEMMEDLKENEIFLVTDSKKPEVLEEYKGAYKDIASVVGNMDDLVSVRNELKTVAVIKG